jgi:hypothetical protein
MIKNFNILNERFEEWTFEKYAPYTFQIKDISKRCAKIIGKYPLKELKKFAQDVNEEVENFAKSEGKNSFQIDLHPRIERFFDYQKIIKKKNGEISRKSAYLALRSIDWAIDYIKEEKLEMASYAIQKSDKLLRYAESLIKDSNIGKKGHENREDLPLKKILEVKVLFILEKDFTYKELPTITLHSEKQKQIHIEKDQILESLHYSLFSESKKPDEIKIINTIKDISNQDDLTEFIMNFYQRLRLLDDGIKHINIGGGFRISFKKGAEKYMICLDYEGNHKYDYFPILIEENWHDFFNNGWENKQTKQIKYYGGYSSSRSATAKEILKNYLSEEEKPNFKTIEKWIKNYEKHLSIVRKITL